MFFLKKKLEPILTPLGSVTEEYSKVYVLLF